MYIRTISMPIFTLYHYAYFQKLCTYTKYNHTGLVDYDKNPKKKMSMLWNDLPGFMTTFNRVFNIIIFTHTCIYY